MQPTCFAIAWLTWKAALRFRLFLVIAALLLGAVVGLPLLIKDDGTARGFTQILLTYTLSAITALARAFHALAGVRHAGARHRGMPDAGGGRQADRPLANLAGQMAGHRVAERRAAGACPARAFMACCNGAPTRLPAAEQKILRKEVLVARGSAQASRAWTRKSRPRRTRCCRSACKSNPGHRRRICRRCRKQIREQVKAEYQVVPPGYVACMAD